MDYDIGDLYNSGQQVVTSYGASDIDTKEAMRIVGANPEFARLVTHRFPLAKFDRAVEVAAGAKAMKVVVSP